MILKNIGMLAISNSRSSWYLRRLLEGGYVPSVVLVLCEERITPGQRVDDRSDDFLRFLDEEGIDRVRLPTADVNAPAVVAAVGSRQEDYFIYSGPGGAILGKELLSRGKKFLHVHPGRLPAFRGSTTVYYQILSGDTCGASAIFLERRIDAGPVVGTRDFPLPRGRDMDLDYRYDPLIRAELLLEIIEGYVKNGSFSGVPQERDGGETYYIMHPVLRHIARLKLESRR